MCASKLLLMIHTSAITKLQLSVLQKSAWVTIQWSLSITKRLQYRSELVITSNMQLACSQQAIRIASSYRYDVLLYSSPVPIYFHQLSNEVLAAFSFSSSWPPTGITWLLDINRAINIIRYEKKGLSLWQ